MQLGQPLSCVSQFLVDHQVENAYAEICVNLPHTLSALLLQMTFRHSLKSHLSLFVNCKPKADEKAAPIEDKTDQPKLSDEPIHMVLCSKIYACCMM